MRQLQKAILIRRIQPGRLRSTISKTQKSIEAAPISSDRPFKGHHSLIPTQPDSPLVEQFDLLLLALRYRVIRCSVQAQPPGQSDTMPSDQPWIRSTSAGLQSPPGQQQRSLNVLQPVLFTKHACSQVRVSKLSTSVRESRIECSRWDGVLFGVSSISAGHDADDDSVEVRGGGADDRAGRRAAK